jgi:hypothetical protein
MQPKCLFKKRSKDLHNVLGITLQYFSSYFYYLPEAAGMCCPSASTLFSKRDAVLKTVGNT